MAKLDLPPRARAERERLGAVLDGLAAAMPGLKVTVDPVENRGFEYHTGISFAFFARVGRERGPLGELGRGGRYNAGDPAAPEPATGFTLYTDTILSTLPAALARRRLLVPPGADRQARGGAARRGLDHRGGADAGGGLARRGGPPRLRACARKRQAGRSPRAAAVTAAGGLI